MGSAHMPAMTDSSQPTDQTRYEAARAEVRDLSTGLRLALDRQALRMLIMLPAVIHAWDPEVTQLVLRTDRPSVVEKLVLRNGTETIGAAQLPDEAKAMLGDLEGTELWRVLADDTVGHHGHRLTLDNLAEKAHTLSNGLATNPRSRETLD